MESRPIPPAAAYAPPLGRRAHLERMSEPWSLNRGFAIAVTLALAILVGSWAANGNVDYIILLGVWFTAVLIIVFVRDYWWTPPLVISALSLSTTALGFPLTGMDIGVIILALTFPLKLAMKTLRKAEPEMQPGLPYWALTGFIVVHAVVILLYNKVEGTPQLKNIIKSYYGCLTPLVMYGLLFRYCHTRTVRPTVILLYIASSLGVFFSTITFIFGIDMEPFSGLHISLDWFNEGAGFILRYGTEIVFTASLAFWPVMKTGRQRALMAAMVVISTAGVMESGGRLSVATCIAAGVAFAVIRRRIWVAVPVVVLAGLISAIITIAPDISDSLPPLIQRSLAPLNFSDTNKSDIQIQTVDSDDFHRMLRNRSLDYWTEDTGSFWIGHGYKSWDPTLPKDADLSTVDFDHLADLAIQMGLTENMFSAITNIFGLAGLLLYACFSLHLAWMLYKACRICPKRSYARALCEFSLISLLAAVVSCPFQGGVPGLNIIYWQLGLLAARPFIAEKLLAVRPERAELPAFARPALAGGIAEPRMPRTRVRP
jgi:hypothetical protein